MVTILTFDGPVEAQALKQRFEAAGVPAHVLDERRQQRYRFLAEERAGIHLQVAREDFERARQLAVEWEATDLGIKQAVYCPQCKSSRVEFPQVTRKFLMPSVYAFLCAIGVCEQRYYCEDCHYTWSPHPKPDQPTDLLGWPVRAKASEPSARTEAHPS